MSTFKAVILAAGKSSRFGGDRPKCLAEISGKALLMYSLESLAKAGLQSVSIVVGTHRDEIQGWLSRSLLPLDVSVMYNNDNDRASIHSFHCAFPVLKQGGLLIESDLIYDYRFISELINCSSVNAVCSTRPVNKKPFYILKDEDGFVTKWGYDLTSSRELVGIYKISENSVDRMMNMSGVEYWDPMISFREKLFCCDCDFMWSEVDTLEELQDARRIWA